MDGDFSAAASHIRICSSSELTPCTEPCREDRKHDDSISRIRLDLIRTCRGPGFISNDLGAEARSSTAAHFLCYLGRRDQDSPVQALLLERGLLTMKAIPSTVFRYIPVPTYIALVKSAETESSKRPLQTPEDDAKSAKKLKSTEEDTRGDITKDELHFQADNLSESANKLLKKVEDLQVQMAAQDAEIQKKRSALEEMDDLKQHADQLRHVLLPRAYEQIKELKSKFNQEETKSLQENEKRKAAARAFAARIAEKDIKIKQLEKDLAEKCSHNKVLEVKFERVGRLQKLLGEAASLSKDLEE